MPPNALEKILFVGDVHVPFEDKRAWGLMLKAARDLKPNIIVAHELEDFYSVSSHNKDPRRMLQFDKELAAVNRAFDELDALGAKRKLYLGANHLDRLERYLREKAPELYPLIDVASLYGFAKRGWEYTKYRESAQVGKLYLVHDVGSAGRNAIFKALEMFEHSVVTGHTHRLAYVVEGNALGENKVSASFGWLGDVEQIDYMTKAKARKEWSLGFGYGYLDKKTGFVYLVPVPLVEYTCVVEGRLYRG